MKIKATYEFEFISNESCNEKDCQDTCALLKAKDELYDIIKTGGISINDFKFEVIQDEKSNKGEYFLKGYNLYVQLHDLEGYLEYEEKFQFLSKESAERFINSIKEELNKSNHDKIRNRVDFLIQDVPIKDICITEASKLETLFQNSSYDSIDFTESVQS